MIRFFKTLCAILALMGVLAVAQQNQSGAMQRRMRMRPPRPQNPADFAPDPPPARTVVAQPVAQSAPAPAGAAATQAAPAVPMVQQPPEDLPPPTPAQVTYRNNLLTVQATNSTLAGLLIAIRNKTGIQFEGLEAGATERVAISMGPAPEGEVLSAILGGSKFDYVVLERQDSPGTVQRVLLSPRAGGSPAPAGAAPPPAAVNGEDDEEADEAENPQDTPVRPPLTQVQPQQPQQPPQAKTPEQLLEDLKRMQQQQQQTQQPQQNAPVKPPPIPQ
jgi:hypothetical protein